MRQGLRTTACQRSLQRDFPITSIFFLPAFVLFCVSGEKGISGSIKAGVHEARAAMGERNGLKKSASKDHIKTGAMGASLGAQNCQEPGDCGVLRVLRMLWGATQPSEPSPRWKTEAGKAPASIRKTLRMNGLCLPSTLWSSEYEHRTRYCAIF